MVNVLRNYRSILEPNASLVHRLGVPFGVHKILNDEGKFGEFLSQHGYNALSKSAKTTLGNLIKMDPSEKERLIRVSKKQRSMGVKDPLVPIMDILIKSKFLYTLRDLDVLTENTSPTYPLSFLNLEDFERKKLYSVGKVDFQRGSNFMNPGFLDFLSLAREILPDTMIDMNQMYWFYMHTTPGVRGILLNKKKLESFIKTIEYLFNLAETWEVWQVVHKVLKAHPRFDFSKKKVATLQELYEVLADDVFKIKGIFRVRNREQKTISWGMHKDYESLPQHLKITLFFSFSNNENSFLANMKGIMSETELSLKELAEVICYSGYTLKELKEFIESFDYDFDTNKKTSIKEVIVSMGKFTTLREFFLYLLEQRIHARRISIHDLQYLIFHSGFDRVDSLKKFHEMPRDYIDLIKEYPHLSLETIPQKLHSGDGFFSIPQFLDSLFLLKKILSEDKDFDITQYPDADRDFLLKRLKELTSKKVQGLGLSDEETEKIYKISKQYRYSLVSRESIEKERKSLEEAGYPFIEVLDFCLSTGFSVSDVADIVFFPERYKNLFTEKIKSLESPLKIDLRTISKTSISDSTMQHTSLGYYLSRGYSLKEIEMFPYNSYTQGFTGFLGDHNPNGLEGKLAELKEKFPHFDIQSLNRFFPIPFETKRGSFIGLSRKSLTDDILTGLEEVLRMFPEFDFDNISPFFIENSWGLENLLLVLKRVIVGENWEKGVEYERLNLLLFKYYFEGEVYQTDKPKLETVQSYFAEDAEFDFDEEKKKGKEYLVQNKKNLREKSIEQMRKLAEVPQLASKTLEQNPEISLEEFLKIVLPEPKRFTKKQRYQVIMRLSDFFTSHKKLREKVQKYKNPIVLLQQVSPVSDVNYGRLTGDIEVVQEGINLSIYFSNPKDYDICTKEEGKINKSGGVKYHGSRIAELAGTISFVNGKKGTTNDYTETTKIHENRHILNGFIFTSSSPLGYVKDECIAYMSHGTSYNELLDILLDAQGLYNYYISLMYSNFGKFSIVWTQHCKRVERYVLYAFYIKKTHPDTYLDILAVSAIEKWSDYIPSEYRSWSNDKLIMLIDT